MSEDHRTEKRCGRCQKIKILAEFGMDRGKRRCHCKDCRRLSPSSPRVDIRDRTEKQCPRCNEIKPIAEFRRKGAGNDRNAAVWHYCRECNTLDCRERGQVRIKSGEATAGYKQRYKKKRWERLLKQYGVTQDQYESLEKAQNGVCAICGQPETVTYKDVRCRLVVDHDHKTGRVRGLLCRACNVALGNFRDDPERMRKAIDYLFLHKQDER